MNHRRVALAVVLSAALAGLGTGCSSSAPTAAAGGTTAAASSPSAGQSSTATPGGAGTGDTGTTQPTTAPTQAAPTTPTAAAQPPVLGTTWATGVQGYGHARPTGLNGGGDPTGIVTNLTWSSWGGATAKGAGSAEYVGPNQSVAQGTEEHATVVAFDLGTCNGKPAYRAVEWYFPSHGQHFDATRYFNPCTGQDHGM